VAESLRVQGHLQCREEVVVQIPSPGSPLRRAPVAILDWETTWTDDAQHPVSVAVVHCELGVVGSEKLVMNQLIKPSVPIRPEATKIHGIDDAKVANSPSVQQVIPEIMKHLDGRVLAAFNLPFDWEILADRMVEIQEVPLSFGMLDPLVWAKVADKYQRGKKLTDVARRRGIVFQAHDASSDAMATARVMPLLLRDLRQMGVSTKAFDSVGAIWEWTKFEGLAWEVNYKNHCRLNNKRPPSLSYHRILGKSEPTQVELPMN
jgi:DNA polymerase III epsilon subunit-like protein